MQVKTADATRFIAVPRRDEADERYIGKSQTMSLVRPALLPISHSGARSISVQSAQLGGNTNPGADMLRKAIAALLKVVALALVLPSFATADASEKAADAAVIQIREELWGIPSIVPMLAYVIRPRGAGPFPLLVMNHGVSIDPKERSYFPVIEFRAAALWFAKQGYVVVAPVRPGYGATAIEIPERLSHPLIF